MKCLLRYCSLLSLLVFTFFSIVKRAGAVEIGALSDDTPASCGCFAWTGDKQFQKGNLIYQELETTDKKFLNMKIDGQILELKKSGKSKTDKYLQSKMGERFAEELNATECVVKANWTVTKLNAGNRGDEASRNVSFKVNFSVKAKTGVKNISAVGYCGC